MGLETIVNLAAQLLFLIGTMVFVVYSIVAIYCLETYGRSKRLSSTFSIAYGLVAVILLGWGAAIVIRL